MSTIFAGKTRAVDRWDIAGVIVLALYMVAGAIYSISLGGIIRFTDERDFMNLSHNLLHGIGYSLDNVHLTACRPPGYPFFISTLENLGGGIFGFRVAQFFILAATIVCVSMLAPGKRMFGGILVVTALVIAYPALFYLSGTLYSQPLAALLFMLGLVMLLDAPRGWGLNLITGLVFGALILTVPTFFLTVVVTLGVAWWLGLIRKRDALAILLAASLPLFGWGTRNAVYLHHFVPVASNSGLNFVVGNNPNAHAMDGADSPGMWTYYGEADRQGMDEFQANTYFWHVGMTWVEEHPGRALVLYLEKVLNFFNFVNAYAPDKNHAFPASVKAVQGASYALLLALVLWRLLDMRRFPLTPREKLFLIVYVLSAFTSAIFLTRIRMRFPYDYLLIAVAALHISRYLQAWVTASRSAAPASSKSPSLA